MKLRISRCVVDLIQQVSAEAAPLEACGLLFGEEGHIVAAEACANLADDPARHFEIDAAALIAALKAERAGGRRLAGYWHSHPSGDPRPSATDRAMAAPDGSIWLIAGGGEIGAWRAGVEGFAAIEWVMADSQDEG